MNVLLFVILIALSILQYNLENKNILSPIVVVNAVFIASSFFIVLNGQEWGFSIHFDSLLIIILYLAVSAIGMKAGSSVKFKAKNKPNRNCYALNGNILTIGTIPLIIMSLFSLITTVLYYQHQVRIAAALGGAGSLSNVLTAIRSQVLINAEVFNLGTGLNIGISFTRAAGFVCIYVLINSIVFKQKGKLRYILPIACIILCMVFSSGRGAILTVISAIIFDLYACLRLKGIRVNTGHILKYVILGIVAFMVAFWMLGKLTGKSEILSLWDTISIYVGSSILCFDSFITNGNFNPNYVGVHTFRGIFNILHMLGFNVETTSNHSEMVRWSHYSSNVYTSFRPYILDFGIIGGSILLLIASFIIGYCWKKYLTSEGKAPILIVYGRFIGYSVVMFSIAERLFSQTLALNALVEIFFYLCIIHFFIKNYSDDPLN